MTRDIPLSGDTICAISTPAGVGGIAVARISGPKAFEITGRCWKGADLAAAASHTAHLGTVCDSAGMPLDQCVATVFRGPRSFTGEDVVEISVHGSRYVQRELLRTLTACGARLAEAGEFTRRAFANGRMDLTEAEAVADVIASTSRAAHRIAISQMRGGVSKRLEELRAKLVDLASLLELELDFSEEEVEFASRTHLRRLASEICTEINRLHGSFAAGNAIKEGIPVAIVGSTNAGKSSLLNALLDDERAITSDIPGTTRDTIEEQLEIGDYMFRFIDTAGIRDTDDAVERIGIDRSLKAIGKARIVIAVVDPFQPVDKEMLASIADTTAHGESPARLIIALNKSDIPHTALSAQARDAVRQLDAGNALHIEISANTGHGLDGLRAALTDAASAESDTDRQDVMITNLRQAEALARALVSTRRIEEGLDTQLPPDLIAQDVRETIHHLSEITGTISTPEILQTIFSRFCIGK